MSHNAFSWIHIQCKKNERNTCWAVSHDLLTFQLPCWLRKANQTSLICPEEIKNWTKWWDGFQMLGVALSCRLSWGWPFTLPMDMRAQPHCLATCVVVSTFCSLRSLWCSAEPVKLSKKLMLHRGSTAIWSWPCNNILTLHMRSIICVNYYIMQCAVIHS